MSEIWHNGVVGLNEMRVFIAKLDLTHKDEAIRSYHQTNKGISLDIVLICCLLTGLPIFIDLHA